MNMSIDKSKPVLVTGANGYVAAWLVKKLLDEGITVHAAVRNPNDEAKIAHLKKIAETANGTIRFFKADLLTPNTYAEAMEGCELIYHTASPFTINVKDPQKELVDPAVNGTANVLNSAKEIPSVKRVVVTSSCAAIYTDAIDCQKAKNGILTENIWNTTASLKHQPYCLSKTLAEKIAWEIADSQNQWDLVAINMSLVMGPALNPHNVTSESMNFVKQIGDGTMKHGVPNMGFGVVDVRDVAEAHFKAGFTPNAHGRYITSAHNSNLLDMALALQPKYGNDFPLPTKPLPKWLLWLIGPMVDKTFTRKIIKNNINIEWKADNSKIQYELGITFRPLRETMEDAFQSMIDAGILQSNNNR